LDLSLPVGFELPDPGRSADVDDDSLAGEDDTPEFAQDFVGD
ncbi:MAG: SMC-Scp complex subunit ScpB, partial [Caulobacterales bacterium 32-67-6]